MQNRRQLALASVIKGALSSPSHEYTVEDVMSSLNDESIYALFPHFRHAGAAEATETIDAPGDLSELVEDNALYTWDNGSTATFQGDPYEGPGLLVYPVPPEESSASSLAGPSKLRMEI